MVLAVEIESLTTVFSIDLRRKVRIENSRGCIRDKGNFLVYVWPRRKKICNKVLIVTKKDWLIWEGVGRRIRRDIVVKSQTLVGDGVSNIVIGRPALKVDDEVCIGLVNFVVIRIVLVQRINFKKGNGFIEDGEIRNVKVVTV